MSQRPGAHREIAKQLIRSATSVGANVEEAQAGLSRADFIAKMGIAQREIRESLYWLRLIAASDLMAVARLDPLISEADEILRILGSIIVRTKRNAPR